MQVFVVGSPLETAMALDKARLRKQIIECHQILAAIHGEGKGWIHHPVVLMYSEPNSVRWLQMYADILEGYLDGSTGLIEADREAREITPVFHTEKFLTQMKRRLYTKNPEHYKQWADLGPSDSNWYWNPTQQKWLIYREGKLIGKWTEEDMKSW